MADTFDPNAIQKLALLSRLVLSDAEQQGYAQDLQSILAYVDKLEACDTSDTSDTAPTAPASRWRDDAVTPGLPLERALQNAPERIGDGFGVPKIID